MKRREFLGDSLARLRDFPEGVRKEAGVQLHKIQLGLDPSDWKPMTTIGPGVRDIRDQTGAFRVIYVAHDQNAVIVLRAFQKKSQQTAKKDLDLAVSRLAQL
jgi:phage-related protein